MDREFWMLLLVSLGEGSRKGQHRDALRQMLALQMQEQLLRQAENRVQQILEEHCRQSRRELKRLSEEQLRRLLCMPPDL